MKEILQLKMITTPCLSPLLPHLPLLLSLSHSHTSIGIDPSFQEVSTLHEFAWARMCVCSRNFGLIVNGIRTAALVPYADMLNHYRPRETKWQFEDSRQGFTIITLNKIASGAQVTHLHPLSVSPSLLSHTLSVSLFDLPSIPSPVSGL
jgi:hypothetical protein